MFHLETLNLSTLNANEKRRHIQFMQKIGIKN